MLKHECHARCDVWELAALLIVSTARWWCCGCMSSLLWWEAQCLMISTTPSTPIISMNISSTLTEQMKSNKGRQTKYLQYFKIKRLEWDEWTINISVTEWLSDKEVNARMEKKKRRKKLLAKPAATSWAKNMPGPTPPCNSFYNKYK